MHLSTMKRVLVLTILIVLALYSIVLYFTSTSVIIEDVSSNEKVMISSINETLQLINKELFRMRGSMHLNSANQSFASLEYHADLTDTADSRITVRKSQKRAVLFTMDSIEAYEKNSRSGGAAGDFLFFKLQVDLPERLLPGELIVRRSLERAFAQFGAGLRVLRSDAEFDSCDLGDFDIVILDAWTWAAKGSNRISAIIAIP